MRHSMEWPRGTIGCLNDIREFGSGGNQNLALHQVNVGDEFRNRMLHLDTGVHLDEVQVAVFVHQKLDGSGIDVANLLHRLFQDGVHLLAEFGRYAGRRRFFHQLLMTPLNGAVTFPQTHHVSVLVGQYLEFDVAGTLDEFLHVKVAIAERRGCFRMCRIEHVRQFLRRTDDPHSTSAAARRGLHNDRKTHLPCPFHGLFFTTDHAVGAGKDGHSAPLHRLTRLVLLAHHPDDFRRRSDELKAGGFADMRKICVFA